jgi:hypothetical protein
VMLYAAHAYCRPWHNNTLPWFLLIASAATLALQCLTCTHAALLQQQGHTAYVALYYGPVLLSIMLAVAQCAVQPVQQQ